MKYSHHVAGSLGFVQMVQGRMYKIKIKYSLIKECYVKYINSRFACKLIVACTRVLHNSASLSTYICPLTGHHVVRICKTENVSSLARSGTSLNDVYEDQPIYVHWFGPEMLRAYESAKLQINGAILSKLSSMVAYTK